MDQKTRIRPILFHDDSGLSGHVFRATQQIRTADGVTELTCQYLHPAHGQFQHDSCYRHQAPLFSRLILVNSGCVDLIFKNSQNVRIRENEIYFLPSDHPFEALYHAGTRCYGFHLYLRDSSGMIIGKKLKDIYRTNQPELAAMLRFAAEKNTEAIPSALMLILLCLLTPVGAWVPRNDLPDFCRVILKRIHENPGLNLRFSELAKEFHISASSLSRQFKLHTGKTLRDFRAEAMLEIARQRLETTELTASEIAALLGYADVNRFFVFFHERMGTTPRAYRKSLSSWKECGI